MLILFPLTQLLTDLTYLPTHLEYWPTKLNHNKMKKVIKLWESTQLYCLPSTCNSKISPEERCYLNLLPVFGSRCYLISSKYNLLLSLLYYKLPLHAFDKLIQLLWISLSLKIATHSFCCSDKNLQTQH